MIRIEMLANDGSVAVYDPNEMEKPPMRDATKAETAELDRLIAELPKIPIDPSPPSIAAGTFDYHGAVAGRTPDKTGLIDATVPPTAATPAPRTRTAIANDMDAAERDLVAAVARVIDVETKIKAFKVEMRGALRTKRGTP